MVDRSVRRVPGFFRVDGVLPRWAGAALAGLAAAAAFPPFDAVLLLPVAVAVLTLCCRRAGAWVGFGAGMCFGLGFALLLLSWLRVIGTDAWLTVAVLQAAFYAALGAGLSLVTRLPAWPLWATGAWVAAELARSSLPFGGLPWGRLAFAVVDTPLAAYARIGGVALVTAAVVLAANLLLWGLLRWAGDRQRLLPAGAAVLGALTIGVAGLLVPLGNVPAAGPVVAVVQGNVPGRGLDAFSERRAVLDNHAAATHRLASQVRSGEVPAPDLVLWPENSTDIDPFANPSAAATISAAVSAVGVPTLVGAVVADPGGDRVRNLGVVWDPATGPGARYQKRHLVPFGEYIPFRSTLSGRIDRLAQIPRDFAPGSAPGLLWLGGARVGDVICFEVAYDRLVRDVITGGAQLLVVQTNNATYQGTSQLPQQWAISRLRAIETGRAVAVAATTGISGFAAPDGTVLDRSDTGTSEVLVERLPLAAGVPLGVRAGAMLEWTLALTGLAAAATALVRGRRRVAWAAGGGA